MEYVIAGESLLSVGLAVAVWWFKRRSSDLASQLSSTQAQARAQVVVITELRAQLDRVFKDLRAAQDREAASESKRASEVGDSTGAAGLLNDLSRAHRSS